MIGFSDFGSQQDSIDVLRRIVRDIPKLNSVDARIVCSDLYETEYGIFNHVQKAIPRPLASVAMHRAEDYTTGSILEESIRTYIARDIKGVTGLNMVEFFDLPYDIVRMLYTIADEKSSEKAKAMASIENEFSSK